MRNTNMLAAFALLLGTMITACQPEDSQKSKRNADTDKERVETQSASFDLQHIDGDMPKTMVNMVRNGDTMLLKEVTGMAMIIPDSAYADYDIPVEALEACYAWYAGGGDYFYLIGSDSGVHAYVGWVDEMQEDDGYHWELFAAQ